jgi:predicted dinucleotide-binding enzyme
MPTMKSAVMLGTGNVGRGFLGHSFSESRYEVVKDMSQIRPEKLRGVLVLAGYGRLWDR